MLKAILNLFKRKQEEIPATIISQPDTSITVTDTATIITESKPKKGRPRSGSNSKNKK